MLHQGAHFIPAFFAWKGVVCENLSALLALFLQKGCYFRFLLVIEVQFRAHAFDTLLNARSFPLGSMIGIGVLCLANGAQRQEPAQCCRCYKAESIWFHLIVF